MITTRDKILSAVMKPTRYTGGELNSVIKKQFLYFISFFSGFTCLALEMVWVRIISFANMSAPQAFSFTLAIFLLGIADMRV